MNTRLTRAFYLLGVFSAGAILVGASARGADWYRWRGPDLNGISTEKGWSANWPDEGPKKLWKTSVGTGFSSMSVSQGRVYTLGNDGSKTDTIYCFDAATGAPIWKHPYPCPLDPQWYEGGPSSTPTVDGDRVYVMSRKGDLFCLDAAKGDVIWKKNVHADWDMEIPTWGFAGSPLVEGGFADFGRGERGSGVE